MKTLCLLFLALFIVHVWADDCDVEQKYDCGYFGIDQQGCEDRGCCWNETVGDPWCHQTTVAETGTCATDLEKKDCGYIGITEEECLNRKCCYEEPKTQSSEPTCFQKSSVSEKKPNKWIPNIGRKLPGPPVNVVQMKKPQMANRRFPMFGMKLAGPINNKRFYNVAQLKKPQKVNVWIPNPVQMKKPPLG